MSGRSRRDLELLQASVRGDAQAFEEVIGQYQSLICAITYSATRNQAKSEELAQEVFLSAWKGLDQLQDLGKFHAWLCSIARNAVQNWLRRQSRDVVDRAAPLAAAAERPADEPGPAEAAVSKEEERIVNEALARIPDSLREPLILFYREHRSVRQVAGQLGISESAVRQRISRSRAMLRDQLATTVEHTIARTRPGKAFTTLVAGSLAGATLKSASGAAIIAAQVSSAGGSIATTTLSGTAAKLIALAVGLTLVAGAVIVYTQHANPTQSSNLTAPISPSAPGQAGTDYGDASAVERDNAWANRDSLSRAGIVTVGSVPPGAFEETPHGVTTNGRMGRGSRAVGWGGPLRPVLVGTITDADTGQPVADAMVEVGGDAWAFTDVNGFYRVEANYGSGSFGLMIESNEYVGIPFGQDAQPTIKLAADNPVVKDFRLQKACMVDLWAVDATGAGIANAEVTVSTTMNGNTVSPYSGRRSPRTDPRGYLLLSGLRAMTSRYLISVKDPGFAPQSVAVRLKDPNVIPQMTLKLERGRQVRGYVEYADGVPAADLAIIARIASDYATIRSTDAHPVEPNGTFTLEHIVPGLYSIIVQLRDGQELPGPGIAKVELPPKNAEPLVLHLKQKSPRSLASISGKLIYTGHNKPRYIRIDVICTPDRSQKVQMNMDRDGQISDTFVIDRLEPGEYQLTLSGDNVERTVINDVKAPSEGLQIQVVPIDPTRMVPLAGTVLDAKTGKPITSYKIQATHMASFLSRNSGYRVPPADIDDEQGQFHFNAVEPGLYQLQIEADGYASKVSDSISTNGTNPICVLLSAGGTIKGYVVDGAGKPISGAKIVPLSKASGRYSRDREDGAVESVGGEFTAKNLSPGIETLRVSHPTYAPAIIKDITVVDGRTTDGVAVVLGKGAAVEGFVYDEQGKPLADDALTFQSADMHKYNGHDPALADAVTDESGFYHVERLPEQLCYVSRENAWSASGVVHRTVLPVVGSTTRLDFGGNPVVTGALVVDGTPPAKARLWLESAENPHYCDFFAASAVTDDHGRFAFRGVVPGTYEVYLDSSGARVAKFAVNAADVDVGRIDYKTTRLLINVNWPTGRSPGHINSILLFEDGAPFMAGTPNRGEPPEEVGQPWIVEHTHPGNHYVLASSQAMLYCMPVTLRTGTETWSVSLDIPKGAGVVTGYIRNAVSASWDTWLRRTEPNSAYAEYRVDIDATGGFSVENLPPGHYRFGSRFAAQYDLPALTEFDLADGQVKAIDLDLSTCIPTKIGVLTIQVIDENGCRRNDARVAAADSNNVARSLKPIEGTDVLAAEPGIYTISVNVPGYRPVKQDVVLKPYDLMDPREQEIAIRIGG